MERMNYNDHQDALLESITDAHAELEPAEFIELAADWSEKINKLRDQAQSEITADVERIVQRMHEQQMVSEYKSQLL